MSIPLSSELCGQRTRIKICGITRVEDAQAAVRAGADAIGLVLTPRSKRCLTLDRAQEICATLPAFVTRVALFMDQSAEEVSRILARLPVDLLQFHGAESPAFCASFDCQYIKAVAMGDGVTAGHSFACWQRAGGLLFDAHRRGESGGQGLLFDWSLLPAQLPVPLILAGGLAPHNVAGAVQQVRPYAVDVSSGVEIAPGIKDHALIQQFVEEVRRGDAG